jgi:xylosylprotein 4-beta-galactosyltransferase
LIFSWGWGLEDDEFYVRIRDAGLKVYRPENIKTGIADTFNHIHDRNHRRRDTVKCFNQKEETRKRDQVTGLDTIKYHISDVYQMTIDGLKVNILNVHLECDHSSTPWCDCTNDATLKEKSKQKAKRGR